jgi:murein DD-endopeptidase MepM/ murein hydrolase activator NlpD
MFKQYSEDVRQARQTLFNMQWNDVSDSNFTQSIAEALTIYVYAPEISDDLLSLAARCNSPVDSLATLNHISHISPKDTASLPALLLLPSAPGLFIAEKPVSDLEQLITSTKTYERGIIITVNGERFRFVPALSLSPTERAFFLNSPGYFRYPLREFRLTSPFGSRIDPISGKQSSHGGLDLAAPLGSAVYASREGVVAATSFDAIYGNYIIIQHDGDWVSLYGHLSKIEAKQGQRVVSGALIGRVGSTGRSTGPHLHFELRQNGTAQDPSKYLFQSH